MSFIAGYDLGDLVKVLGLPKHTRRFTMYVECDDVVRIEAEYYPEVDSPRTLIDEFLLYRAELVPRLCDYVWRTPYLDTWRMHNERSAGSRS